jgi:hypothetical protein
MRGIFVRRAFIQRLFPALALALLVFPAAAFAQAGAPAAQTSKMVEVDPIRCWWKTSDGAVRIGQTFTLTLTCAVLQNDAVQVVPDESRLGAAVVQMAPFEIVSGSHPNDLYTSDRRFFQYEYVMRLINPDMIGKDVRVPDQIIHYRVNSRVAQNAAIQGKDNIYDLPIIFVRVLSLVPVDATDIRDTGNESFEIAQNLGFRASVLEIVAIAAAALGALFVLLSLVRLIVRTRKTRKVGGARGIGDSDILRHVGGELADVQKEAEAQGWNAALVDRALAATRVAAAVAVGRPVGQRPTDTGSAGEGRLLLTPWRRRAATISGGVTTVQITQALNALPDTTPPSHRRELEELQESLSAFTVAQYARVPVFDRERLDEAMARARAAAARLRSERAWPKPQIRRWTTRQPAEAR